MRNESIQALVDYAERTGLIESADRVWAVNRLLEVLHADTYTPPKQAASGSLADILRDLCDCALETGALEQDSVVYRDLFDTKLMGALTPAPSQVQNNFTFLYNRLVLSILAEYQLYPQRPYCKRRQMDCSDRIRRFGHYHQSIQTGKRPEGDCGSQIDAAVLVSQVPAVQGK